MTRGSSFQEKHTTDIIRLAQEVALATPVVVHPVSNPVKGEKATASSSQAEKDREQTTCFSSGLTYRDVLMCNVSKHETCKVRALNTLACVLESSVRVFVNQEEDDFCATELGGTAKNFTWREGQDPKNFTRRQAESERQDR